MRPTLLRNRKFVKLARILGSDALALGHLELLWHAANETGDPMLGDADDVESLARWQGERGALVRGLCESGSAGGSGFLDLLPDGRYAIHDFWHHAPDYVRKRAAREAQRRANGDRLAEKARHGSSTDQTLTGQHPGSDQAPSRTPAPAPAPAPAQKEDSALANARAVVDGETPPTPAPGTCTPTEKGNGLDRELERAIIGAYHEELPDLPKVRAWSKTRHSHLSARVRQSKQRGKAADTVDYWRTVFRKVAASDFLMGRKTDFRCPGLAWLIESEERFSKLIEGSYDNAGGDHGRRR